METDNKLALRLISLSEDQQLSVRHIGIYFALLNLWYRNKLESPFRITRKGVMQLARIGSIATYHKCIADLADRGYITYQPSYDPYKGSCIYIL
ncbi:MAG: hypothetical protein WC756_15490 [Taibaiella sp.]|jgi:hypothetical protein